jgi:hypothetical protein
MPRLSAVLCAIVCASAFSTACSAPPQKEINRAQEAIDTARAAGADQYAPEAYTAATAALRQSHEAVEQRDYRLALSLAVDASDRAQEAARAAAENKARVRRATETAVTAANTALLQLEARVKAGEGAKVPARDLAPARTAIKDAHTDLQKARALLAAENYSAARDAVAGLDEEIRSEIRMVEAAITLRTARRPVRKR